MVLILSLEFVKFVMSKISTRVQCLLPHPMTGGVSTTELQNWDYEDLTHCQFDELYGAL